MYGVVRIVGDVVTVDRIVHIMDNMCRISYFECFSLDLCLHLGGWRLERMNKVKYKK